MQIHDLMQYNYPELHAHDNNYPQLHPGTQYHGHAPVAAHGDGTGPERPLGVCMIYSDPIEPPRRQHLYCARDIDLSATVELPRSRLYED